MPSLLATSNFPNLGLLHIFHHHTYMLPDLAASFMEHQEETRLNSQEQWAKGGYHIQLMTGAKDLQPPK